MTGIFTEKKRYSSRTVTFHEFCFILFCTTKSELPRRRAGDRYKHVIWIYLYIQTNTSNKNTVYFACSPQRDSVDFYGRHEGDAESA